MKKTSLSGKFLVIEGLDGSGKSTQIKLLGQELKKKGLDYFLTREHTREGPAGSLIERVVNYQEKLNPIALQLLFVVDRLDHLEREIKPGLEKGKLVVSDRYYWTTVAYGSRVANKNWLIKVNKYCLEPDLTIYIDVSPEEAIRRTQERGEQTIFEKLAQMKDFKKTYYWLLEKFPDRSVRVDGERLPEEITKDIIKVLEKRSLV
ncbi:MAG: dTMP kinase [Candidatus Shapirobacteria bacterium]|nr:dTMP kinase [Candidatus Shapirobacteria bacterium]